MVLAHSDYGFGCAPAQQLVGNVARMFAYNILCLTVEGSSVRLVLDDQLLEEDRTLSDYNIQNETTLTYILEVTDNPFFDYSIGRRVGRL